MVALLPHTSVVSNGASDDPFVTRFHSLDRRVVNRRRGPVPALLGNWEQWKSFIEDAVREDARPSRELIAANRQLAAWEAHLGVGRVSSFPESIAFAFTGVCNARCVFCAYAPERTTGYKITLERIERADWLKFCRVFRANSTLGEPFAHPHAAEMFSRVRELAPYINLGCVTNGSLLKPAAIDAITGFFSFLYVSINAARKETYEATMRGLSWEQLLYNLAALRDAKAKARAERPVMQASYVVHRYSLEELPEFPRLIAGFGFQRLMVRLMVPPPNCSISDGLLSHEDSVTRTPELTDRIFRELEAECAAYGIQIVRPLPGLDVLRAAAASPFSIAC